MKRQLPVEKERQRRRDVRATKVRLCGVCKGIGTTKPMLKEGGFQESFVEYYWDADARAYVSVRIYVRRMGCWACNGSGLNCSQQRARELELAG